jgi:hypothetical protein
MEEASEYLRIQQLPDHYLAWLEVSGTDETLVVKYGDILF